MLKIKHGTGKNGRPYTILVSKDGKRLVTSFDPVHINLALTLARDEAIKLAETFGLNTYRSLLLISEDWEIDIQ